jgi:hypothetical protein
MNYNFSYDERDHKANLLIVPHMLEYMPLKSSQLASIL